MTRRERAQRIVELCCWGVAVYLTIVMVLTSWVFVGLLAFAGLWWLWDRLDREPPPSPPPTLEEVLERTERTDNRIAMAVAVLVFGAAVALMFTGCAHVRPVPKPTLGLAISAPEVALDHVLRLIGRFVSAHACPIGPREALTNAHVVDVRPFDLGIEPYPYQWSDAFGASGFVVPTRLERGRDLAELAPLRDDDTFPAWLPVANGAPDVGTRVWLLGFDFKTKRSAMAEERIEAKVTRIVADHVLFVPSGKPGSSGSCLINERGEVVGINEGGFSTEDHGEAGLGVGIWGALKDMPK